MKLPNEIAEILDRQNGTIISRDIAASSVMNERWRKYQREFPFAADVGFDRICKQLDDVFSKVL